jgi:hypothetical protein
VKTNGHRSWTDEELEKYRAYWPYGSYARLVFELAFELAARRIDIGALGPQHIKNGCINFTHAKERENGIGTNYR